MQTFSVPRSRRLYAPIVIALLTSQMVPASLAQTPLPQGPVVYVATTGSNTGGNGSSESPWATISYAVTKMPDIGGTIIVRDGTYRGNVAIRRRFSNMLTIRAEHAYAARLRHDDAQALSIWDAQNVVVTGFDIAKDKYPTSAPLLVQIARSSTIALIDNIIHDSNNNDVLKINESPRDILIANNVFANQEGSAGQHIDVNGATDVTIRDNIFFNDTTMPDGTQTHGYVVIKNSGSTPESRRIRVTSNTFYNYQGNTGSNYVLIGEDGQPFHEAQDVVIENNLMIGNSNVRMRAPFGAKGARDVIFRNNTIVGDLPSSAFAMRLNRENQNPRNRDIFFANNVWADPFGTMGNFSDGSVKESVNVRLDNNVYWNGGAVVPLGQSYSYVDDQRALIADPKLGVDSVSVLPTWLGNMFRSGSVNIRREFERLVIQYGVPGLNSALTGRSDPATSASEDIFGLMRKAQTSIGAVDSPASVPSHVRIALTPNKVTGGSITTLNSVFLRNVAGQDGMRFVLKSSNPALAFVPAEGFVAPGTSFGLFEIRTAAVSEVTDVIVSVSMGGCLAQAKLTILPRGVNAVNLGPDEVMAGTTTSRNLVWLNGVAESGAVIKLSTTRPDLVTLPASVNVAPGMSYSEYFPLSTKYVGTNTVVPITATWGSSSATVDLTITPPPFKLTVAPTNMVGEGRYTESIVTIDDAAPIGGAEVFLTSSHPDILHVPTTIRIPEGESVQRFEIVTGLPEAETWVTVKAQYNGRASSAQLKLYAMRPYSMTLPTAAPGSTEQTGSVTVNGLPAADLQIPLSVAPGSAVTVPPYVIVRAGTWSGSFKFKTQAVSTATPSTITATYNVRTASATTTVQPPLLSSISVPSTLAGGKSTSSASLNLSGPAPATGAVVQLTSSDPSKATVASTVSIPAGANSAAFTITSPAPVASSAPVTISASYAGSEKTAKLTITQPTVMLLYVNTIVGGGVSYANNVVLTGPAPSMGMIVELKSSDAGIAAVPPSITIPAGTTEMSFPITTTQVAQNTKVTITASCGGVSKSVTATVTAPYVSALYMYPASVIGGASTSGSVSLSGPALPDGTVVTFTSSDPQAAPAPDSITIAPGAKSGTYTCRTLSVTSETSVTITALGGGSSKSVRLVVKPK